MRRRDKMILLLKIFFFRIRPKKFSRYAVMWASTTNLGDDIQTLAAINLLKKHGIDDFEFVNRERLAIYSGPPVRLIMNGWFTHRMDFFPPSPMIRPLFISFHWSRSKEDLTKHKRYFKKYEPIGCRDLHTVNLFQSIGVEAFFTGCLTLTFDEVKEKTDKIYKVDVNNPRASYIPRININLDSIPNAEVISNQLTKILYDSKVRLNLAQELLDKYRKAKLVVTSRLHCALPCRAFNTDVIFVHKKYNSDIRFGGLHDYLNGYNGQNEGNKLDMSYRKSDRDLLKKRQSIIKDYFSDLINKR